MKFTKKKAAVLLAVIAVLCLAAGIILAGLHFWKDRQARETLDALRASAEALRAESEAQTLAADSGYRDRLPCHVDSKGRRILFVPGI